jgi:predicted acylesterase/phospholipase RssA
MGSLPINFLRLGIPIDMVAGTSIGAFVGAVYATEADPDKTVAKCKEWSMVRILNI